LPIKLRMLLEEADNGLKAGATHLLKLLIIKTEKLLIMIVTKTVEIRELVTNKMKTKAMATTKAITAVEAVTKEINNNHLSKSKITMNTKTLMI
jgi:hypothetical protein